MGQPYGPWQGPGVEHHGAWWGILHLLPFVMVLVLIGVGLWAVLRITSGPVALSAGGGPAPLPPCDTAVEELRIGYSRGELEREDYAQRMRELGGADIGDRASRVDPPSP